jgi:hypothetical protein
MSAAVQAMDIDAAVAQRADNRHAEQVWQGFREKFLEVAGHRQPMEYTAP